MPHHKRRNLTRGKERETLKGRTSKERVLKNVKYREENKERYDVKNAKLVYSIIVTTSIPQTADYQTTDKYSDKDRKVKVSKT